MPIKLVSLNIEGKRHLNRTILPFLQKEKPDVITLQEVFEQDRHRIERTLGMKGIFVPLGRLSYTKQNHQNKTKLWGLLTLSKLPIRQSGYEYYYGNPSLMPDFYPGLDPNIICRAILWIQVTHQKNIITFVNTHFIWSYNGEVSDLQKNTLISLFRCLNRFSNCILSGDFNSPRGKEIFSALSGKYKDNIPHNVTTTIDNAIHRSVDTIQYVVDGIFSSPIYSVTDVAILNGISDHIAMVCMVNKNTIFGQIRTRLCIYKDKLFYMTLRFWNWLNA